MLNFICDYNTGCHPEILKRLQETNMEPQSGYGADAYCESAARRIAQACGLPDAQVEFTVGGTQTNQLVISSMLGPLEGVISAGTGHVNSHESGAIEVTGHKVLSVPGHEGRLLASEVDDYVSTFYGDENHSHMVYPGMVYISYPTEYGTLYTKKELEDIKAVCTKHSIPLFIDGALCGEAIVFTHGNRPARFVGLKKQRGALLAKGRLLGVQFDVLFTDDLYFRIARNAIERANELKALLSSKGYSFLLDSPTNQQFVILEDSFYKSLSRRIGIEFWEKTDAAHTAVRFATSWSTTKADIEELKEVLDNV
ncbi:MAG: low specificity L-threonine aldolase [Spirochaetales bacterium]|nr:low specificity L-threonine aldolase [Spirochaetales bacterium]